MAAHKKSPFTLRTVETHQVIFDEGDPAEAVYTVKQGAVEIRVGNHGGNPQILTTMRKGDVFGELALLENRSHRACAVAVAKTELVEISSHAFLLKLNQLDPVMKKVVMHLATRLHETTDRLRQRDDVWW